MVAQVEVAPHFENLAGSLDHAGESHILPKLQSACILLRQCSNRVELVQLA